MKMPPLLLMMMSPRLPLEQPLWPQGPPPKMLKHRLRGRAEAPMAWMRPLLWAAGLRFSRGPPLKRPVDCLTPTDREPQGE